MNDISQLGSGHPERFSFDSEAFPPAERFRRYSDINAGGAVAREAGPNFLARVDRWRLDRAVLHECHFNDVIHELDAAAAAAAKFDHFMITLVRSTGAEADFGAGLTVIPPGSVCVIDLTRGMRSRATNAHLTSISVARDVVLATGAAADELHGLILDPQRGALLADFLTSLVERIDDLPGDATVPVTQAAIALFAVALDSRHVVEQMADMSTESLARLNRVRRTIEQRLSDPQFGAHSAVEQSGLSRATVYRLFQPYGGLAAYIHKRRLDRVRVALSDMNDRRPLAQIVSAAGFLSESHCSRAFKVVFGIRPGQYRAALARARQDGTPELQLNHWHDELR